MRGQTDRSMLFAYITLIKMVKAKKWVLSHMFVGEPKLSDFKLVEENLNDDLGDDEILVEALYISVDPYVRGYADFLLKPGDTLVGRQLARVIKSNNKRFAVDALVLVFAGWRSHTILRIPEGTNGEGLAVHGSLPHVELVLGLGDIRPSLALGMLGLIGLSAYFGLLRICDPKPGETVLVSGAAGAVGNVVGQIAKIKGCRVIGFTGSDEKCKWLKEIGFDSAFNYKKVDLDKTLTEAAPDGIDCYFDNVGGDFTLTVLRHMKEFGRVSLSGAISQYNATSPPIGDLPFMTILFKQLRVEGWLLHRWTNELDDGLKELVKWIKEGKLVAKETVTVGFENTPQAFCDMLNGKNTGKAIVKC